MEISAKNLAKAIPVVGAACTGYELFNKAKNDKDFRKDIALGAAKLVPVHGALFALADIGSDLTKNLFK